MTTTAPKKTIELPNGRTLAKLADQMRSARGVYAKAARGFMQAMKPLSDDEFWRLQPVLRDCIVEYRFGHGRTNGVEQGCREFFRKVLADDFGSVTYTMEDAIRFMLAWGHWQERLYEPLFDVIDDKGDDAYCDFLDSLPLASPMILQKAERGEYTKMFQIFEDIDTFCDVIHSEFARSIKSFIKSGENYVRTSLSDAAEDSLARHLADSLHEREDKDTNEAPRATTPELTMLDQAWVEKGLAKLREILAMYIELPESDEILVYSTYGAKNGFKIVEMGVSWRTATGTSGWSWLRSEPEAMGIIAAAEDVVTTINDEAFRPEGWASEIDEHADAVWRLEQLLKESERKT